ncbi:MULTISPECIES: phasin [Phyllobacteriaceae]|uniref:Phasin n=1 Tax=Phyllobacterium phragmitis TaxID=2670329 RepID=A0ABQ0GWA7_9HYPH|nr:phasin [Mesorhizobium sp. RMAD-H1]MBB2969711.1 phasin [Mesorhizobium sp. RMAD-H1]
MSKKPEADIFAFPGFDPNIVTDRVREFTEGSIAQSREAYARFKDQAEAAQKTLETTLEAAQSTGTELSRKAISALRANTDAGFTHLEALFGAKTFADAIELQTAFVRQQTELAVEQAKEFQSAATKAVEAMVKPTKAAMEKAAKDTKAA